MISVMAIISEIATPFQNVKRVTDKIIIDIGKGDKGAFNELYEHTDRALYGYILSFLKNPQDSEDVMQETYIRIRQSAKDYTPCGKPMAWIFRIARNLSLMHIRKYKNISIDDMSALQDMDLGYSVSDKVVENIVLRTALNHLNSEERQVVILHSVTGLKHREIAEVMGLSLTAVLTKYNRSMKKLKKLLLEME